MELHHNSAPAPRMAGVDWPVRAFIELTPGNSFRLGIARLATRIAPNRAFFLPALASGSLRRRYTSTNRMWETKKCSTHALALSRTWESMNVVPATRCRSMLVGLLRTGSYRFEELFARHVHGDFPAGLPKRRGLKGNYCITGS
jgi:hypothetical protein